MRPFKLITPLNEQKGTNSRVSSIKSSPKYISKTQRNYELKNKQKLSDIKVNKKQNKMQSLK